MFKTKSKLKKYFKEILDHEKICRKCKKCILEGKTEINVNSSIHRIIARLKNKGITKSYKEAQDALSKFLFTRYIINNYKVCDQILKTVKYSPDLKMVYNAFCRNWNIKEKTNERKVRV